MSSYLVSSLVRYYGSLIDFASKVGGGHTQASLHDSPRLLSQDTVLARHVAKRSDRVVPHGPSAVRFTKGVTAFDDGDAACVRPWAGAVLARGMELGSSRYRRSLLGLPGGRRTCACRRGMREGRGAVLLQEIRGGVDRSSPGCVIAVKARWADRDQCWRARQRRPSPEDNRQDETCFVLHNAAEAGRKASAWH